MKKIVILLLLLFIAVPAIPAILSWGPPATDVDGGLFTAGEQAAMTYRTYSSPYPDGPWALDVSTGPGVLSAVVPEPAAGTTLWYTADVTLDGQTSVKSPSPVSKTVGFPLPPLAVPLPPGGLAVQ